MRIAVIGAGLAGLAASGLLAARGHEVAVLERALELRPLGAGLLLQPPGVHILRRLGSLDVLEAGAARITRLHGRTTGGRDLLALRYADLHPDLHGLGLTRPAIWSFLLDRAVASGVRIQAGHGVSAVTSGADQAEVVIDGMGPRRFDLAVIAAGTHSVLWGARSHHVSRPYPWGCLWSTVSLPDGWPLDTLQQRCLGTRFMAGILPIGAVDGRQVAAFYWSIRNDAVPAWRAQPLAAWHEDIARVWPEAATMAGSLDRGQIEHAAYRDVWVDPTHAGRVVVIGDAAHGTSPQLGQGTTQALLDGFALAETLAGPGALPEQMARYWSVRRARTRYYRLASRMLTPVFQSATPGMGLLRDAFAGPAGRLPIIRRHAVLTLVGAKTGLFGHDQAHLRVGEAPLLEAVEGA